MMRKDAGNTYGLVPRKLVAMLSHDGTAWFVDELVEAKKGTTHKSRRPKTPPPSYESAMNDDEEDKEDEEHVRAEGDLQRAAVSLFRVMPGPAAGRLGHGNLGGIGGEVGQGFPLRV